MHFQPGGSHGWGLLSVYEPSFGPQFEALLRAVGKLQTQQTPRQTDTQAGGRSRRLPCLGSGSCQGQGQAAASPWQLHEMTF